jgi:hypothetical protein
MNEALKIWKSALFQGNQNVFRELQKRANLKTAIVWMAIAGGIGTLLGFTGLMVYSIIGESSGIISGQIIGNNIEMILSLLENPNPEILQLILVSTLGGIVLSIFVTPSAFLLISLFLYIFAKLLGGKGSFEEQTYLLSTFAAPLYILSRALLAIPILGLIWMIATIIYELVLAGRVMKVVHLISFKRVIGIVIVPVIALFAFYLCSIAVMAWWWFY